MKITILPMMPAGVEGAEPRNEFTEMQADLDRAGWRGTGCTKPFEHDDLSGGADGAGKGKRGK